MKKHGKLNYSYRLRVAKFGHLIEVIEKRKVQAK